MKNPKELNEELEKLSISEEFKFEMSNHSTTFEDNDDFSIITIKTKNKWLDLNTIDNIRGLKISEYDGTITAIFSIKYN